ncbi:hypothetical protein GF342_04570 [Candidatus Woesearchaeota archaeon]|nr:hypothetical protein [Candidatus Woesearchaeota archaeon]
MKVAAVLVPRAGMFRRRPHQLREVMRRLRDARVDAHVSEHLSMLPFIIDDLEDVDCVSFWGGDGTLHRGLSQFRVQHGYFPLTHVTRVGTGNVVAADRGITRHCLEQCVEELSELVQREPDNVGYKDYPILCARTDEDVQYGFMFGTGLLNRFLAKFHDGQYGFGKFCRIVGGAAVSLVAPVGPLKRYRDALFAKRPVTVETDTAEGEQELFGMLASAFPFTVYGTKAFRDAGGGINVLLLGGKPHQYVRQFGRCVMGSPPNSIIGNHVLDRVTFSDSGFSSFSFESEIYPWSDSPLELTREGMVRTVRPRSRYEPPVRVNLYNSV